MLLLYNIDEDYKPGPYSVTIRAGTTNGTSNVQIKDDDLEECKETFDLVIQPSSLPSWCKIESPTTAEVTIIDDECKYKELKEHQKCS